MTEPAAAWVEGVEAPLMGGIARVGSLELTLRGLDLAGGIRWDWSLRNAGPSAMALKRVGLQLTATPARVLEHGWQSWSPVRSCAPGDARPGRRAAPRWVASMLLAEGEVAGSSVRGDQFLVSDIGVVGSLGGAHHLTTIECPTRARGLTAWALLDGVALPPGAEIRLDPLWIADGDPGRLYSAYAGIWGDATEARQRAPSEAGWCSWYQYYGNLDPAAIRANLE
ncbi:MAG: hypothetical protein WB867_05715, partial [Candidatus Dormiibacterota bacterium]